MIEKIQPKIITNTNIKPKIAATPPQIPANKKNFNGIVLK